MHRQQRGMTFLGLLILVTFVGLFVYAGIRLTPAYLEYMTVSRILEDLPSSVAGSGAVSPQAIRQTLEKRFDIDGVRSLDWRDVEITRDNDMLNVRAVYDVTTPFVANLSFLVHFDRTVVVPAR